METSDDSKNNKEINRRQFFKTGAVVGTAGALLGSATAFKKKEILIQAVRESTAKIWNKFPALITDKCERMDQKNTVFCRQLWDRDFVKKITEASGINDSENREPLSGWTQLEDALNAAGWAVDHQFAPGSENGQPHTQAYSWDEPASRRKFKFESPRDAAKKIKKAASFLGADLVGITPHDPLWDYAQLLKIKDDENQTQNGPPQFDLFPPEFPFDPKSVVVIAVEMNYQAIALSPSSIEGAATGRGYSRMSTVGYSVATFIRRLGYKSFACGNDVSLSIPYAVAAGLGELGRNGMLITQEFGPRVRLVKVYTELEIEPDPPQTFGVWEFCKSCRRCAESCPSQAISLDKPTLAGKTISNNPGVLKWYINPEKCIQFWRENGSDCALCITVCPYNKPRMWHHQLSAGIASIAGAPLHSLMTRMDKLFGYGRIKESHDNTAFWDSE